MSIKKTYEILTRRISMTQVDSAGREKGKTVVGWEYASPQRGEGYSVYLGRGKVLRTSPVEDIQVTNYALILRTANSIYRVEYL